MARPREFDIEKALEKAMATFWERGYDGTSMTDLTEAMEISRSSLYETFGDKQQLFYAALNHYIDITGKKRIAILAKAGSVKQGMHDFLHGVINFALQDGHPGGCFFTNTAAAMGGLDVHTQDAVKRGSQKMEDDFFLLLEQGRQSGEIGQAKDSRALAIYFVTLVRGIAVMAKIKKDRKVLTEIAAIGLTALE